MRFQSSTGALDPVDDAVPVGSRSGA